MPEVGMLLGSALAFLLAQAADVSPSPEGRVFAVSYAAAMNCAAEFARMSPLAREGVERIPHEAIEQCSNERDSAADNMMVVIPDSDRTIAYDNVSARMRIVAADVLISRLEQGDYPGTAQPNDPLRTITDSAARLVFCLRTALARQLEGVYLGDNWFVDMRGKPADQISSTFIQIGQESCPVSEAAFQAAYGQTERSWPRSDRAFLRERISLEAIQALAVEPYLAIVLH